MLLHWISFKCKMSMKRKFKIKLSFIQHFSSSKIPNPPNLIMHSGMLATYLKKNKQFPQNMVLAWHCSVTFFGFFKDFFLFLKVTLDFRFSTKSPFNKAHSKSSSLQLGVHPSPNKLKDKYLSFRYLLMDSEKCVKNA